MAAYASLMDIDDRNVQNAQELASIWGEVKTEFEEHNAEVLDSYAILGEYDFLVVFDAADREAAFKSALTLRRHGLSAQTMGIVDTDDFATLVDEV
ncbi:GYD domain-containing protein [Natronorubrum sp. DTA28]|uniref:GYD domain-containing protein n=1 Tax=Natronorubrum sp. DTA28 TaxID=3447019 RepID=UPI003F85016B